MRKYGFLVFHKDHTEFLETIKKAGVLHIETKSKDIPEGDIAARKVERLLRYNTALKGLKHITAEENTEIADHNEIADLLVWLETRLETRNDLIARQQQLHREKLLAEPWGTFSTETIDKLTSNGLKLWFFSSSRARFENGFDTSFPVFEIGNAASKVYFVVITNGEKPEIEAEPHKLPSEDMAAVQAKNEANHAAITQNEAELLWFSRNMMPKVEAEIADLHSHIEFSKAIHGSKREANGKLLVIDGWVPLDKEAELVAAIEPAKVYYEAFDATMQDNAPIILKQDKFSKLFQPIADLYTLPDYRELDITPFLAPFYMMFFGFCLGDAGYGLMLLAILTLIKHKVKPELRRFVSLGQVLMASTTVMGFISGTFFGINLIDAKIPWLEAYKGIMLDQDKLMVFALILGYVQILTGMVINTINVGLMNGAKYAVSKLGWVLVVLAGGLFYWITKGKTDNLTSVSQIILGVGGIGFLAAIFYNSPGKNPFVNFGVGLWETYGIVTGFLGDILSYIRLFALALSGAILGNVFNQLAVQFSPDLPVAHELVMIIILIIGHAINIFLASLGAFVHPLRLTFVEFYKNAGFTGGGVAYSPLK